LSRILGVAGYGWSRAVWKAAAGAGGHEALDFFLHRIALRRIHRQTRCFFFSSTATLPPQWAVFPRLLSGLEQGAQLLRHLGGGTGAWRRRGLLNRLSTRTTTREKQQRANQRSNLMCEDLSFQPINRCGTVNRSPSDRLRVQWPDQGRSGPPCRPVVSLRFPSFLLVSRRFSGVPHQICVERRLWAAAVFQSRSDPGRNVSETATTTREG